MPNNDHSTYQDRLRDIRRQATDFDPEQQRQLADRLAADLKELQKDLHGLNSAAHGGYEALCQEATELADELAHFFHGSSPS